MAYYFLFPESDTTIYSQPDRKELNAGSDEILEIVKERGSEDNLLYPSRILLKFKNEEIQDVISNTIGSSNFNNASTEVTLNLTAIEPKNLVQTLNLNVFAVSQSWDEGTGRYSNLPTSSNGTSWKYRFSTTDATEWITTGFAAETTGSISSSELTAGGGVWYTGSNFQSTDQYLVGQTLDTNFNVTNIVKKHSASLFADQTYPDGIDNNGFIIKKPNTVESDTSHSFGELQYFSVDTHTIHPPKLTFKWDDSYYNEDLVTTANRKKTIDDLNVTLYNNKEEYNQNDTARFRIHIRDKYPIRQFASSSNFLNVGYFPTSSYYSIRDAHTEQEIIPFNDNFTKLSTDEEGMYFKIHMKGLQPERYYRVLFKHKDIYGTTIYDDKYYFKVVR
tara:strand:+ start:604 stop:1773 length:1170 start_codon:yes stop_codon:yes gene_type:complete